MLPTDKNGRARIGCTMGSPESSKGPRTYPSPLKPRYEAWKATKFDGWWYLIGILSIPVVLVLVLLAYFL